MGCSNEIPPKAECDSRLEESIRIMWNANAVKRIETKIEELKMQMDPFMKPEVFNQSFAKEARSMIQGQIFSLRWVLDGMRDE